MYTHRTVRRLLIVLLSYCLLYSYYIGIIETLPVLRAYNLIAVNEMCMKKYFSVRTI